MALERLLAAAATWAVLTFFTVNAHAAPQAITLQAADHVSVAALVYEAPTPKAIILLRRKLR